MATYHHPTGMVWHPYAALQQPISPFVDQVLRGQIRRYPNRAPPTGRWVHHPMVKAIDAFKGFNIATTIGQGNYMTRNFRQKPIVGLQTATHKNLAPLYKKVLKKIDNRIDIPTVSQRRVKKINQNKMLGKVKAMPYRKTYRKKTKATTRKKARRSYRRRPKIPLGIPRSKIIRLKATWSVAGLGSGSGAMAMHPIKANSLNDPAGALVNNLPLYTDQYAALYQKYIVLGSKLTFKPYRAVGTGMDVVGIHLADNSTSLADHDYYREQSRTRSIMLTDQKPSGTVSLKYSGKKFWKLINIKDDSEQEASFSTTPGDPTDVAYYHVFIQDMTKGDAVTLEGSFIMEWIVLLTDPVTPTRSNL